MVETAVTDVVRGTVTTDDPLTALNEVVVERLELLANGAALGSALGDALAELRSNLLGLVGILLVGNPLLGKCLVLWAMAFMPIFVLSAIWGINELAAYLERRKKKPKSRQ